MTRLACALVVAAALLLGGCSDDGSDGSGDSADVVAGTVIKGGSDVDPDQAADPADGLTFTRAVGTTYEMHGATVDCRLAERGGKTVVRLTSPENYEKNFQKGRVTKPYFYVEALPGTQGRADLPLAVLGDKDHPPPVAVVGVDSADQNEFTGAAEVATGSIVVLEATCDPQPRLSFTIRATLAGGLGLPPMHVLGGLAGTGKG